MFTTQLVEGQHSSAMSPRREQVSGWACKEYKRNWAMQQLQSL